MKKVLYGVAMALVAIVSFGSLQSCKDDLSDLRIQTNYDVANLQAQLNDLDSKLQALMKKETVTPAELAAAVNDMATKTWVEGLLKGYQKEGNYLTKEDLLPYAKTDDLKDFLTSKDIEDYVTEDDIQTFLQKKGYVTEEDLDENGYVKAEDLAGYLKEDALVGYLTAKDTVALRNAINGAVSRLDGIDALNVIMRDSIAYLDGKVLSLESSLVTMRDSIGKAYDLAKADSIRIDELVEMTEILYSQIQETQQVMTQMYNLFNDQIEAIDSELDAIIARLDQLVTGIIIQSVESPVFGDFSLPIGVKNNILFGYYAKNERDKAFKFPTTMDLGAGDESVIKPGSKSFNVPAGYYNDSILLGKVYVTLNPIGHQFNEKDLSIVNSQLEALPFGVKLKPSSKVLTHGLSRSTISSGLYEGEIYAKPADLDKIVLNVNGDLRSSMESIIKDPSKHNALNVLKAVYHALGTQFTAYGLQYGWTVTDGLDSSADQAYSILSGYDLAITTTQPISFNFLAGKGSSKQLPTIGHIDNLILKLLEDGDLHFKFDPITFNNIAIKLPAIEIGAGNVDVSNIDGKVTAKIESVKVYEIDPNTGKIDENKLVAESKEQIVEVNVTNIIEDLANQINNQIDNIKNSVEGWSDEADQKISEEVKKALDPIAKQINDMLNSINGQIDDMVSNIGNKFQGIFDKVNNVVDLYNRVANKVNHVLANPNHYLQVTALYDINGGFGMLSTKKSSPTPFVKKGGDAVKLYLTTYTGELIAPAYMKYVQVVDGNSIVEEQIMSGSTIGVALNANNLEKGKVYSVNYQALDYSGYTSTQTFYIQVK